MKKLLPIILVLIFALSLFSCGDKYPPVESTAEESQTVFTLSYDGREYEVKYELYRALFTSMKESVDGGDDSVWSGENKAEYVKKINEKIIDYAAEIYSTFSLCERAGINVYSNKYEDKIDEYIELSVEGGIVNGLKVMGFEGDYQKYLDSLKKEGVNYSVQRLLLRYSIAVDELSEHYIGEELTDGPEFGEIKYTESDIDSFYYSDECVRVIYAYLSSDAYTENRANEVRDVMASKTGADAVANYVISHTTTLVASDVKFGLLIAKNNLDDRYFGEIRDAAFSLEIGKTSEVITLNTGSENGFVIMYRVDKSGEHLAAKRTDVINVYLENEFGKILLEHKNGFVGGFRAESLLSQIDHATICAKQ